MWNILLSLTFSNLLSLKYHNQYLVRYCFKFHFIFILSCQKIAYGTDKIWRETKIVAKQEIKILSFFFEVPSSILSCNLFLKLLSSKNKIVSKSSLDLLLILWTERVRGKTWIVWFWLFDLGSKDSNARLAKCTSLSMHLDRLILRSNGPRACPQ